MRRATAVHPRGSWSEVKSVGRITLPADQRHRRRIVLTDDAGTDFLLDLPRAAHLRDGDGLMLEGGGFIAVTAALEEVADVECGTPEDMARAAWHIGNRHTPVQVLPGGGMRIPADHVLIQMLEGLGASVKRRNAQFQPEPGAYDPHGLMAAPEPKVKWA